MVHARPDVNGLLFRPASPAEMPSIDRLHRTWAQEMFSARSGVDGAFPEAMQRPLSLISPGSPEHRSIVAEARLAIVGLISTVTVNSPVTPSKLAQSDALLAAFVEMTPADCLHVCSLAVLPVYRRRGIASRLVSIAGIEARALGSRKLSVTIFEANVAAREFFRAAGFSLRQRRRVPPATRSRVRGDIVLLERDVID